MPDIALEAVTRVCGTGEAAVHALRGVDLHIDQGEFVSVVGPSGAGKSTILNLVSLLDAPTSGRVLIGGIDPATLHPAALARLRSATFGFVFQGFHLMEEQSVVENVMLGMRYRSLPLTEQRASAMRALADVGLADRADELARNLSGGQRQRVAIARALVAGAPVLVADEPTGNLDSATATAIMEVLRSVARSGRTVIIVTHSDDLAAATDRTIAVHDGLLTADRALTTPGAAAGVSAPDVRPRGRDSRLAFSDLLRDAWGGLAGAPRKTLALVIAVALGVGLATATLGLASSAKAQVSATFDAQRNRQVLAVLPSADIALDDLVVRSEQVRGIDAVGARLERSESDIAYRGTPAPTGTLVYEITDGFPEAAQQEITWLPGVRSLGEGQVVIGAVLAEQLSLGPMFTAPTLSLNGHTVTVVGMLEESSLEPEMMRGLLVSSGEPAALHPLFPPTDTTPQLRIYTAPGAAQQVAGQLPLALDPLDPDGVQVMAPPDPATHRAAIESTVAASLTVLSAVAVLAAVVSLMNSMSLSVVHRSREFGLRRALGARATHLRALVLTEALFVGLAGGICGLFVGMIGVLGTSLVRGWSPVFDPILGPAAIAAGALVAIIAGLVAAARAGRIQPVEALRH
ncbi:MAG: ATP-binding cassette domain-containing protein [Dermabacter sp.]|nr:ATP-binding cassette domain-containing protein [Dermabacter sp.]